MRRLDVDFLLSVIPAQRESRESVAPRRYENPRYPLSRNDGTALRVKARDFNHPKRDIKSQEGVFQIRPILRNACFVFYASRSP